MTFGLGQVVADRRPAARGLLIDVWGVLFDGQRLFKRSIEALNAALEAGFKVALVSNTSRRSQELADLLRQAGASEQSVEYVVTAGELAFQAVTGSATRPWPLGRECLVLGEQPGGDWLSSAGLQRVQTAERAQFALAVGVLTKAAEGGVMAKLQDLLRHGRVLVVTNPDQTVEIGGVVVEAAGAVGRRYKDLGGRVLSYGKPGCEIFQAALGMIGCRAEEALMVGDGIGTDGVGSAAARIPFVLVGGTTNDTSACPTLCAHLQQLEW